MLQPQCAVRYGQGPLYNSCATVRSRPAIRRITSGDPAYANIVRTDDDRRYVRNAGAAETTKAGARFPFVAPVTQDATRGTVFQQRPLMYRKHRVPDAPGTRSHLLSMTRRRNVRREHSPKVCKIMQEHVTSRSEPLWPGPAMETKKPWSTRRQVLTMRPGDSAGAHTGIAHRHLFRPAKGGCEDLGGRGIGLACGNPWAFHRKECVVAAVSLMRITSRPAGSIPR